MPADRLSVTPRPRILRPLGVVFGTRGLLTAGCGFSGSSGNDWSDHHDEDGGFEVSHPTSWSPEQNTEGNDVLFTYEDEDEDHPACSVKREPSRGLTADQLEKVGKTFIRSTKRQAKGFRVHSKGSAPVGSDTGYAVTWSFRRQGKRMVLQQRYTLRGDRFAVLSCGDYRGRYDEKEPLYDRFFKSFRWTS